MHRKPTGSITAGGITTAKDAPGKSVKIHPFKTPRIAVPVSVTHELRLSPSCSRHVRPGVRDNRLSSPVNDRRPMRAMSIEVICQKPHAKRDPRIIEHLCICAKYVLGTAVQIAQDYAPVLGSPVRVYVVGGDVLHCKELHYWRASLCAKSCYFDRGLVEFT